MATYTTAVTAARMTALRDYFAGGSLELLSASDVVLVSIPLSGTGGTVSGSTWTLAFTGPGSGTAGASTGTTATKAQLKNSGGTVGTTAITVGGTGSGANIILNNTSIAQGQSVTITAGTISITP